MPIPREDDPREDDPRADVPPALPVEPVRPGGAVPTPLAGRLQRGGVPLGAPFGVPVRVSVLGVLVAVLLAGSTLGTQARDAGSSDDTVLVLGLLGGLLLEASVLAHEIAHCVAARLLGLRVGGLRLWALGGLTEVEAERRSPLREYVVAVVGPLTSVLTAGICGVLALHVGGTDDRPVGMLLFWLATVNALLAAFNLLPGLPLDGGRVLRAVVWRLSGSDTTGTRAAAVTGFVVAGVTVLAGLLVPGANGSAFLAFFVAAYVAVNAQAALRSAGVAERTPGLSAGRLARRALTAPSDLPLGEALRRAGTVGATALVVTSSDGRARSLVSGARVDATPADRRPWVSVGELANPITEGLVLDARLVGQAVLDALREHPASEYLVVEPAGAVLGVLATVDVVASIDPRQAARAARTAAPAGWTR